MPSLPSVIDVLERAYDRDVDLIGWLGGIAAAAYPLLDSGMGLVAWTFDGRDLDRASISSVVRIGGGPELEEAPLTYLSGLGQEVGRSAYLVAPPVCTASEVSRLLGVRWASWLRHAPPGCRDCLAVSGIGPDRLGVMIGVPLPKRREIGAAQRRLWARIAIHLVAGFRLHQGHNSDPAAGPCAEVPLPLHLTEREEEVCAHVARGHQLKLIAYELDMSPKTVSFHLRNALAKLGDEAVSKEAPSA